MREAEADATEEPDAVPDEAAARVIKRKSFMVVFLMNLKQHNTLSKMGFSAETPWYWYLAKMEYCTVVCAGGVAPSSTS